MNINDDLIDVVILGAGAPSIGEVPSPLKQISRRNSVIEWQLNCFKGIKNINNIYFIGGYKVAEIKKRFPDLKIIFNRNWKSESILDSLFKLPKINSDLIVTYSDTLFRKEYLKKLSISKEDVSITIDSYWKNRYSNRSKYDLNIAEKIKLKEFNNSYVEFTGLIKLKKSSVNKILSNKKNLKGKKLVDLIKFFHSKNIEKRYFDVKGDWAELNETNDLVRFVLGTKAESLDRLYPMVKKSKIGKSYFFNVHDWKKDKNSIIKKIYNNFKDRKIVIRSSSSNEDSWEKSSAGKFKSFINIDSNNEKLVKDKIDLVIKSYPNISEFEDEILIQEFIEDVKFSGVIFTCDLATGGPYYKINYDYSGKTNLITSGKSISDINVVINKEKFDKNNISKEIKLIIDASQEIESLLIFDKLDIEFAVDYDDNVHIFQVRPIVVDHSKNEFDLEIFRKTIDENVRIFNRNNSKFQKKYNRNLIYSNMPDWNPAEIIGTRPYPLAYSIYEEVITNEIWALQRSQFGYKSIKNRPLLYSFSGQPFVDCSLSFKSFIPKEMSKKTSDKLLLSYIDILSNNKELFDKIEFEIAFTCWIPNFRKIANERLSEYNFDENEIFKLESSLKKITTNAIKNYDDLISPIYSLEKFINKVKKSKKSELFKIKNLIEDCKIYGTLPFAHAARNAFISTMLLKSFVEQKIISEKRLDEFFRSIRTIASEFESDIINSNLSEDKFKFSVKKYGHLRPGTYEITSEPYWKKPEKYLVTSKRKNKSLKKFIFNNQERKKIIGLLATIDKNLSFEDFESYLRKSIEDRERVKFEFTKSISYSLDLIEKWGKKINVPISEIKFLTYKDIKKYIENNDLKLIKRNIEKNKEKYIYTKIINLPDLIENENDFYYFQVNKTKPNFISNKKTISKSTYILREASNLNNKIILIENADPGYDWLFSKGISGLITKYGGANSHMAIRSAEIGIPAAIGVGEILFDKLKSYKMIELDSLNKVIRKA